MQEKKQYTLYDIAAIANVAPSTVSRVVNGVPGISKSTRTKVQRVLDAYHYVPNETARGLATQSSKLIGILISDIRLTHHADGVFYVEQELAKRGYSVPQGGSLVAKFSNVHEKNPPVTVVFCRVQPSVPVRSVRQVSASSCICRRSC